MTYADEAHHSTAGTYQQLMNYFRPKLFLGMTATPDKRDDGESSNVYEIFNYQIAYEIRLQQAMEENLLCPFHYFGISDIAMLSDKEFKAKELADADFNKLTSDERVRHVIEQAKYYGYSGNRVKGLIFCSRKRECQALSAKFNELGYRTVALSGEDDEKVRQDAFERLAMEESDAVDSRQPLDYIFSVDILNEGVDIVEVNQVIMLRPTQSPIVFIQQLGRGLRKAKGKPDYADAFVDNVIFKWDSQIGRGPESGYMQDVITAKRKHLLIKKSDAENGFYYMGTFDVIEVKGDKKQDNNGCLQDISKVTLKMHHPVREDLLRYLESKVAQ